MEVHVKQTARLPMVGAPLLTRRGGSGEYDRGERRAIQAARVVPAGEDREGPDPAGAVASVADVERPPGLGEPARVGAEGPDRQWRAVSRLQVAEPACDALSGIRPQRQSQPVRARALRPPLRPDESAHRGVRRGQGPLPRRHRQRRLGSSARSRSGACPPTSARRRPAPACPIRPSPSWICSPPRRARAWPGPTTCWASSSTASRR